MGLFDTVFKGKKRATSALSNEESLLGVMVAIVAADGAVTEDEIAEVKNFVNKSNVLSRLDMNTYTQKLIKVFKMLESEGVEKLLMLSIDGLSEDLYEGTFILACDLAYADGTIQLEEEIIIDRLQQGFEISREYALTIIDVISKKNRI